jgi:hypothetical protein
MHKAGEVDKRHYNTKRILGRKERQNSPYNSHEGAEGR